MKTVTKTFALLALGVAAGAASAQQNATSTIVTQLTLQSTCTMAVDGGTATAPGATSFASKTVNFGSLPQNGTALNATSAGTGMNTNYAVACGQGVTYTLSFDQGQYPTTTSNATTPARRLALPYTVTTGTGPTATTSTQYDYIAYNLVDNSSGNAVGTTTYQNQTGSNTHVVKSKVTETTLANTHRAGTYTDTVGITLSYQ